MASKYEDLEKLRDLFNKGIITENEYNTEKEKILGKAFEATKPVETNNNGYCALMHLSQFSSYILPGFGIIVPIVMWAMRKNESNAIDVNGKVILNWKISILLYSILIVTIFLVGGGLSIFATVHYENPFPILGFLGVALIPVILFGIMDLIFTIIGAIKANNGEVWNYPLSLRFFRTK